VKDAIVLDEQLEISVPRNNAIKLKTEPGADPVISMKLNGVFIAGKALVPRAKGKLKKISGCPNRKFRTCNSRRLKIGKMSAAAMRRWCANA